MAAGTGGGPLDALLGNIFQDDEEVELMGGINFQSPLKAAPNLSTKRLDVSVTLPEDGGGGGGGASFPYTYAGSGFTGDSDPGPGIFRGNNAILASSTQLFFDDVEANGTTVSSWFAKWDDAVSSGKGTVRVQSKSTPTKWLEYPITAYTPATGYSKISVGASIGPGGLLSVTGDTLVVFDAGATGSIAWSKLATAIGNLGFTGLKYHAFTGIFAITPTTGSVTIDAANGQRQQISLTGNVSVTLTTPPGPMSLEVTWVQDVTGGRTVTFVTTVNGDVPPISTASNDATSTTLDWDGSAWNWNYSLVRNPDVSSNTADRISGSKIAPDFGSQTVQTTGPIKSTGSYIGVGATIAASGSLRGGTTFSMVGLTGGGVDAPLLSWLSSTPKITLGPGNSAGITGFLELTGSGVTIKVSTNNGWDFTAAGALINNTSAGRYSFGAGVTAPAVTQEASGTSNTTGSTLTIASQATTNTTSTAGALVCSGGEGQGVGNTGGKATYKGGDAVLGASGTRTGGDVDVVPGAGATTAGTGRLKSGGNTVGGGSTRYAWSDAGDAFFGATVAAQPARVGQLTDSSGGTPSSTLPAISASPTQAEVRDSIASLAAKINALELVLHNSGRTA